jgi:tetratricopeptide (TPR) repeat protein
MIAKRLFPSLLAIGFAATATNAAAQQPQPYDEASERALRHATPEWESIASHLPDPATATPAALTQAADVLRARRLPEDALDYYRYALKRGGDEEKLQNDIGVTLLELRQYDEARTAFKRALQLKPKSGQEWNNLGATEYVSGNSRAALADYLRAVKLDKKRAVFHSNLGTAYFELKDYESARQQFEKALQLDPSVFQSGGFAGVEAHVLGSSDHGRFCFEMAKMSARIHDDDNVVRWLARSSEAGFDVKGQMAGDKDFDAYRKDPRIETAIRNAKAMRTGQIADSGLTPPLPEHVQ